MSIRKKIFFYNSIVIVLLLAMSVFAMWYASKNVIGDDIKEKLVNTVLNNADNLSSSDGIVYVDDTFDFYREGVYLSLYSSDGSFISGISPENSVSFGAIEKGVVRTNKYDGVAYYIYDYEVQLSGRDSIYLRGITSDSGTTVSAIFTITAIVSAVLAVLYIIASFFVSKSLTEPLVSLSKSINGIESSGDLQKRIEIDTTDREIIELKNSFNKMLNRLDALFKNEERFTSDVSHELRTPLTVILSETEYSLEEAKTEEEKKASLQVVERQTKKLVAITNQLLEFSRLTNKQTVQLEDVDLSALVKEFFADYVSGRRMDIAVNVENGCIISGNEIMLVRLIQNLTDNAVKYGKENGKIEVAVNNAEGKCVLSVKDDGIGMSGEELNSIFERFYRADESRSKQKGLGLGLSFVREIVRLHGAEITVSSKLNEGTEFTVKFDKI